MAEGFLGARVNQRSGRDRRKINLPVLVSRRSGCSRGRRKDDLEKPYKKNFIPRPLFVEDDCGICAIRRK